MRILAVKRRSVVVDGNHPLAGKVLVLDVVLLSLASPCGTASWSSKLAGWPMRRSSF
jgi:hypothetical protein